MKLAKWFMGKGKAKEEEDEVDVQEKDLDDIESDHDESGINNALQGTNNQVDFYPQYLTMDAPAIARLVQEYQPMVYSQLNEPRWEHAHRKGGSICHSKDIQKKYRSVGKEVIKEIGKKLLSGNLNLTKISFPIKAMISKSVLESAINGTSVFPLFMTKASLSTDPVERMRLVISGVVSSFYWTNQFYKPLNPILGETLQGHFGDGSQVYAEQISHHPPVSYFLLYGPQQAYRYSGYYNIEAKAGLNNITILNKGKRQVKFKDGQCIDFDFSYDYYSGTFFGTLKLESLGQMVFTDKANQISCTIQFGKTKGKPSDYFQGDLIHKGTRLGEMHGSYIGYVDYQSTRYWQYDSSPAPFRVQMDTNTLPSDHLNRKDLIELRKGNMSKAQANKEQLEELQRADAKKRKANTSS